MSNINKTFEITSANQDLFADLNEKDSEKVRGGIFVKNWYIVNNTGYNLAYSVGLKQIKVHKPNKYEDFDFRWEIVYDRDPKKQGLQKATFKPTDSNSPIFEFKDNKATKNPNDIILVPYGEN